jgi:hypothetical protein
MAGIFRLGLVATRVRPLKLFFLLVISLKVVLVRHVIEIKTQ